MQSVFRVGHVNKNMEKSKVFLIQLILGAGYLVFAGWVNNWLSLNEPDMGISDFNRLHDINKVTLYFFEKG